MSKNSYQRRKESRIARYEELAQKHWNLAQEASDAAHSSTSWIELGQPVVHNKRGGLTRGGKAQKRAIDSSHSHLKRWQDHRRKAEYWERKARAASRNNKISLDDPDALTILEDRLEELLEMHDSLLRANQAYRSFKKDPSSPKTLRLLDGFSPAIQEVITTFEPEHSFDKNPIPSSTLTSSRNKIKHCEQQIEKAAKMLGREDAQYEHGPVVIVKDTGDNRIRIELPHVAEGDLLHALRSYGFIYSKTHSAWQRMWTENAEYALNTFLQEFFPLVNCPLCGCVAEHGYIEQMKSYFAGCDPCGWYLSVLKDARKLDEPLEEAET